MKMRSTLSLLLVALATCALVAPVSAEPTVPSAILAGDDPPAHVYNLALRGSNGFRVEIQAISEGFGRGGQVKVGVRRKKSRVLYDAPANVTATTIEADLGPFGKVDLTLRSSGREKTIPIRCGRGRTDTYEPGTWEGVVVFRGERGFTHGRATRLAMLPHVTSYCDIGGGGSETLGGDERGARLTATSFAHGRALSFQINKNHVRGRALYWTQIRERRDGISIHRAVGGWLPARAFQYAPDLQTARLSPPAPFSGSASLRRAPNSVSPSWRGDLAIDFLGRTARLAGPGVHVSLVHACFQRFGESAAHSC